MEIVVKACESLMQPIARLKDTSDKHTVFITLKLEQIK